MSNPPAFSSSTSRFAPQNQTTNQRLSTHTVGLVALSDFRKRRAEVLEQQEREARDAAATRDTSGTNTPELSAPGTPNAQSEADSNPRQIRKKKKKTGKKLLSFDDDEDQDEEDTGGGVSMSSSGKLKDSVPDDKAVRSKFKPNASISIVPKSQTQSTLRQEAAERETLRREFLAIQEAVKATEVAIPFVFYDGGNTPGGIVRVKKGDFVWLFLDKARRVGAELRVGEKQNAGPRPAAGNNGVGSAQKAWARVGVDDLMLVRGTVIIPHHYAFHYFVINKSLGPGGARLFDYSAEAPETTENDEATSNPLTTAATKAAALSNIHSLEGANDDPSMTKVVDRRWYERHKHIYPSSTWQQFDPEKDYSGEVRRDTGGNTFFFSR